MLYVEATRQGETAPTVVTLNPDALHVPSVLAFAGSPVTFTLADGVRPASVELIPADDCCPTCKRRLDDVPERDGRVDGNRFLATKPGRYVVAVADRAGRKPGRIEVACVDPALLDVPRVAVVQRGPDRGQPRSAERRRALLTALVRDREVSGEDLSTLAARIGFVSLDPYAA